MSNRRITPTSTWNSPPTPKQIRSITYQCTRLGIKEPLEERVTNRVEAKNLIYELRGRKK